VPKHYPLSCADVKTILKKSGFVKQKAHSGSSHEQWKKVHNKRLYKVTVDCPKAPFSPMLITSMARQAGMTKRQFYAVIDSRFD
jgi:predicted RNA binding protein YcfA (HicA-like mRNA interferase family)